MTINNLLSNPYFDASFERQEWVHEWVRPTVQHFIDAGLAYYMNTPIAIMLEMQGGLDGYLLLEQCTISYKTRAPLPINDNIAFWKEFATSTVWIAPSAEMRFRLGKVLGLAGGRLLGVDRGNFNPDNFHCYSILLARATSHQINQ